MSKNKTQEATETQTAAIPKKKLHYYRFRFRKASQEYTAQSHIPDLSSGDIVMVSSENCPEPAVIVCRAADTTDPTINRGYSYKIMRRANQEEGGKYARLPALEKQAIEFCQQRINLLNLQMHLVRVERYFNGSKIIFYFTSDSRVDFRELVKDLVQEFRTRVEMRQIGVRHETQMIGGIGACGRELCCTSFLRKFESVSIKMAKAQDLPLNPAKISGLCNRLLCCLTYEYDTYKAIKREMPRIGRLINHEGTIYRVVRIFPMQGTVQAVSPEAGDIVLSEEQWKAAKPVRKKSTKKSSSQDDTPKKS